MADPYGCCCWPAARGEWWERLAAGEPAVRALLAGAGAGDRLPVPVAAALSNDEVIAAAVPALRGHAEK